jgi:general nucleoside transport system ATP-binding protein
LDHIFIDRVTKSFAGFRALDSVSLRIGKGEIHAILGENGAGKTTLMNILYGLYQPDEGQILLNGVPLRLQTPKDAITHGIGMIHQHFMLVNSLSVTENIVLGLDSGLHRLNIPGHEDRIREMSAAFGFDIDPIAPVGNLPMGMRQRIEILKALYRNAEVLILDEPTSVLTPNEVGAFLASLRNLRDAGHTILFITHKLEEVMQVADRVTVMRKGRVVAELEAASTTSKELARSMIGREILVEPRRSRNHHGEVLLAVENLIATGNRGSRVLDGLSLAVRSGEILGVTGVDGNGQRELGEVIAGLRPLEDGRILVAGKDIHRLDVKARKRESRIAFVPEDRQATGLVSDYSIAKNLILRDFDRPPVSHYGFFDFRYINHLAAKLAKRYDIRLRSIHQPVGLLSGGNQQKLVLAREIEARPRILVAAQACKGLDVGAIEFVQNTILDLKSRGVAVLYISTELEHVLAIADRIAVIYRGRITGTLAAGEATPTRLGELMAGISAEAA